MSNFDDHNQRWNDDLFPNRNDGSYGGLSISEVLQAPYLAEQYGLETHHHDIFNENLKSSVSGRGNLKLDWYLVLAQAVGVAGILFFTFMF